MTELFEVLAETLTDTLKMLPILFIAYLLIEFINSRLKKRNLNEDKLGVLSPAFGAIFGCIPQCGFSAAGATLYDYGIIGTGTLVAVFLSTSDEALSVLFMEQQMDSILWLVLAKLIIALVVGYVLKYVFFRKEKLVSHDCDHTEVHKHTHEENCGCEGESKNIFLHALTHSLKIAGYVLISILAINLAMHFIGEEAFHVFFLKDNFFQPFLTALVGLIPGCGSSVLITEMFVEGAITFGSLIAGLCSGAGFGYLILFRSKKGIKNALKLIGIIYAISVASGIIINLF